MPKISQLTDATTVAKTDSLPIVQSGTTKELSIQILTPNINVRHAGMLPGSAYAASNTAIFTALLAAISNDSGANFYFPGSGDSTDNSFYLNGEFETGKNGIVLSGDNIINSTILWTPTADNQIFFTWKDDGTPQLVCKHGGARYLQIKSTDTTYTKTVFYGEDIGEMEFHRLYLVGFNNNASIGFKFAGREITTLRDVQCNCDRPVVFVRNPNESTIGLDADLFNFHNFSCGNITSAYPAVEFETGAYPWNVAFTGCNVIAGHTQVIKCNQNGTLGRPNGIMMDNMRHEQIYDDGSTPGVDDGSQYSFDIVSNATAPMHKVILRGCKCDATANGIKLSNITTAIIEGHRHTKNSKVALNLTNVGMTRLIACDLNGDGSGSTNTATLSGVALDTTADLFRNGETGIPSDAVYIAT